MWEFIINWKERRNRRSGGIDLQVTEKGFQYELGRGLCVCERERVERKMRSRTKFMATETNSNSGRWFGFSDSVVSTAKHRLVPND